MSPKTEEIMELIADGAVRDADLGTMATNIVAELSHPNETGHTVADALLELRRTLKVWRHRTDCAADERERARWSDRCHQVVKLITHIEEARIVVVSRATPYVSRRVAA
jgi:hypothetical protein